MNYCITTTHIIYLVYQLYYWMADLFTLNDLLFMSLQPNHAEGPPTHQKCTRDSYRSFEPWPAKRNGNQWRGSYVQPGPNPCHSTLNINGVLIVSDSTEPTNCNGWLGDPNSQDTQGQKNFHHNAGVRIIGICSSPPVTDH